MPLIARYKENGNGNDSVGSNNLTDNGNTYTGGVYGQCANFSVNDYQDGGDIHNMGTSDWSISFLVNPNSISGIMGLVGKTRSAAANRWGIFYASGNLFVQLSSATTTINISVSDTYTPTSKWTRITATWDRDGMSKLYIGNKMIGSADISPLDGVNITDSVNPFHVASYPTSTGNPANYFDGKIEDIRPYNHVLSQEEIDQLSSEDTDRMVLCAYDFEDNSDLGYDSFEKQPATNNGATQGVGADGNNCAAFVSSSSQFIDLGGKNLPALSGATKVTFSAYMYKSSGGELYYGCFSSATNQYGLLWFSDDRIYFAVRNGASNNAYTAPLTSLLDQWVHVVGIYDGSQAAANRVKIYVNKVSQSLTISGTTPTSLNATVGAFAMGKRLRTPSPTLYSDGCLDKVWVFNYDINEDQIEDLYNFREPRTGNRWCELDLRFEDALNLGKDSSGKGNNGTNLGAIQAVGKFGYGASFDGTNDYIEILNAKKPTKVFTITGWLYNETTDAAGTAFAPDSNSNGIIFAYHIGGLLRFYVNTTSFLYVEVPAMDAGFSSWVHWTMTYDGSYIKVYKNGDFYGQTAQTGDINIAGLAGRMWIGTYGNRIPNYKGIIDSLRLYNDRLLPQSDIIRDMCGLHPISI